MQRTAEWLNPGYLLTVAATMQNNYRDAGAASTKDGARRANLKAETG